MYKRIKWAVVVALMLVSPALFALGLGSASVDSYLDQPLDVRVELISRSSDELQSITAGLASADDFQMLGLSRSAINVPLDFEIVTEPPPPPDAAGEMPVTPPEQIRLRPQDVIRIQQHEMTRTERVWAN